MNPDWHVDPTYEAHLAVVRAAIHEYRITIDGQPLEGAPSHEEVQILIEAFGILYPGMLGDLIGFNTPIDLD